MNGRDERRVILPRAQAEAMIAHARSGKPEEVCGLVAEDAEGRITATLPVENGALDKRITYHMEPRSQHRAFMEMEEQGWELAGLYHSHPATRAYPSPTDQGLAFDPFDDQPLYPDMIYFIVSLADDEHPVIRAYLLPDPETIEEIEVAIE
ncbi:MAG: M67 family metallopeptidase [Chloroflexota bacterium]|nr:M67 family metallopeptidase [Chloroflexota bacterium]